MNDFLEIKNPSLETMITITHQAVRALRDTVENESIMPTDPTATAALNRSMIEIIQSDHADHPAYNDMKKYMVPYTEKFFKKLEMQGALHKELASLWKQSSHNTSEDSIEVEDRDESTDSLESELISQSSSPDLFSTDDLLNLAPESSTSESEESFIKRAQKMVHDNPMVSKFAGAAGDFAKDLAGGIASDAKTNLRRGASEAMQGAMSAGISRMTH